MTVKSRKDKINKARTVITKTDKKTGHPTRIDVKGTDNEYSVTFKPAGKDDFNGIEWFQMSTNCIKKSGWQDCKGNSNGHICYHSLAAMHKRVNWQGKKFVPCDSFQAAINLLNFGGVLVKVVSGQGNGEVWGIVR